MCMKIDFTDGSNIHFNFYLYANAKFYFLFILFFHYFKHLDLVEQKTQRNLEYWEQYSFAFEA